MFVSTSCPHPTRSALNLHNFPNKDDLSVEVLCLANSTYKMWDYKERLSGDMFILQQVDRNTLGQWISCAAAETGFSDMALIWQRYSCLECIIRNLSKGNGATGVIYVIIVDTTSRMPKSEEAQESSPSGSSANK